VVFCPETAEAVETLPDRLEKIASTPVEMQARRAAIDEIWRHYGDGDFIYDIRHIYEAESAHAPSPTSDLKPDLAIESLLALAAHVPAAPATDDKFALAFLAGCKMRLAMDRSAFLSTVGRSEYLASAIERCRHLTTTCDLRILANSRTA